MSDFTKEELGIIYCNLAINPKTKDILIKLQSMFNNYCEHKETENIGGWVWKCVKCGMQFGDETQ